MLDYHIHEMITLSIFARLDDIGWTEHYIG
jgi:hypothetical protein